MTNIDNCRYAKGQLIAKLTPITDDYFISDKVLGLGINGKVVECIHKHSQNKYALKVSFILLSIFTCISIFILILNRTTGNRTLLKKF